MVNLNPLSAKLTKWLNTLKQFVGKLPTNCLSVFGHFMRLVLKGLIVWPVYGNQILIYLNISIFYLCSQCSRSKFNFLFQLSSYATKKVFLKISLAINMASQDSYCKFPFLDGFLFFCCHSKMPKTPKMLMKKHVYW